MLPPPASPLFPYTTLFRSELHLAHGGIARFQADLTLSFLDPKPAPLQGREEQPRSESTRLNSSHLVSSYAAFCLKKKKYSRDVKPPHPMPRSAEGTCTNIT